MAVSEAHKRASAKYDKNNYKMISVKMKISEAETLNNYVNGLQSNSRNKFIINCIKYCMENNITFENKTE